MDWSNAFLHVHSASGCLTRNKGHNGGRTTTGDLWRGVVGAKGMASLREERTRYFIKSFQTSYCLGEILVADPSYGRGDSHLPPRHSSPSGRACAVTPGYPWESPGVAGRWLSRHSPLPPGPPVPRAPCPRLRAALRRRAARRNGCGDPRPRSVAAPTTADKRSGARLRAGSARGRA